MPMGAGKYDPECTQVRETAKAQGAVVIVLNGDRGNGFSIQASLQAHVALPAMLRFMADEIEKSLREGKL